MNGHATKIANAQTTATSGLLRFEIVGSLLEVFLNDALLVSVTDTSISAAGSIGVYGSGGAELTNGQEYANPATLIAPPTLTNFDAQLPGTVNNVWLSLPTQSGPVVTYWLPGASLTDVSSGDFNGDGKSDLVGLNP